MSLGLKRKLVSLSEYHRLDRGYGQPQITYQFSRSLGRGGGKTLIILSGNQARCSFCQFVERPRVSPPAAVYLRTCQRNDCQFRSSPLSDQIPRPHLAQAVFLNFGMQGSHIK
jgi:hypothetical protein